MKEINKQMCETRRIAFFNNSISWLEKKIVEALIALVAAFIVVQISQHILIPFVYEAITNTVGVTGVVSSVFTLDQIKAGEGLGIAPLIIRVLDKLKLKETWLVLFGVRFVIDYLFNGFSEQSVAKKSN